MHYLPGNRRILGLYMRAVTERGPQDHQDSILEKAVAKRGLQARNGPYALLLSHIGQICDYFSNRTKMHVNTLTAAGSSISNRDLTCICRRFGFREHQLFECDGRFESQ